jgi:glutamate-1-semialdehyde 2,1-aminomutase
VSRLGAWRQALGRGIFPHQLAWFLELPLRRLVLSPELLASRLPLRPDASVLEIGPGSGYYSLEVARRIPAGRLELFDVQPDLSTFGKGMANGFAVAALVGRREVMEVGAINRPGQERTFLVSTTHGGEMASLAAFLETVAVYEEQDVVRHLWDFGAKLRTGLEDAARDAGVGDAFQLQGNAISMNYLTHDAQGRMSLPLRTLFSQEMIRHGVLMPWIAPSFAHGDPELQRTLEAARKALAVYAQALEGGVERFLQGPAIKPVFRQFN